MDACSVYFDYFYCKTKKLQSCTKLVGTHALLILIMFIIKMYVYKMTCMIQYPCSKHASSPSLPHQAMLVYTCLLFIPSALSLTTLTFGERGTEFLLQNVPTLSYKIVGCAWFA